ncbi:MAG: hypothetical protein BGO01_20705 [Armatimonadetes bacterium 55-13]|nr:transcriptional repressor [Armatimonadota bacterium]OJU64533.1 MAG: hypothetical protein BGO01_20705 [Armatimonadetes bacterium 55-13]
MEHTQDFASLAMETLKKNGYKFTLPRHAVVSVLASLDVAVSAHELYAILQERGKRVDCVSVYRILEVLEELSLIYRIGILDHRVYRRFNREAGFVLVNRDTRKVLELDGLGPWETYFAARCAAHGVHFKRYVIEVEVTGDCDASADVHCETSGWQ